jgi:hypothetical protein
MAKDQSRWLVGVLPKHDHVAGVERIGRGLVKVERKAMSTAIVGILSAGKVTLADIEPFLVGEQRPAMIVNIPTNSSWMVEAMERLEEEGIAFGKMYDLYRGLSRDDDLSTYQNPEFYFVERIFEQHGNVSMWKRVSDRAYRVIRYAGPDFVIALSNAYEVTADVVRTAYADHHPFDILFKTNPYGRISSEGREVADRLGVRVLDANTLHSALAK